MEGISDKPEESERKSSALNFVRQLRFIQQLKEEDYWRRKALRSEEGETMGREQFSGYLAE